MMGWNDRSLRILHMVHQYPPHALGGTELVTQTTVRELAARGATVSLWTRIPGDGQGLDVTVEDGVRVYRAWDGAPGPGKRYLDGLRSGPLLAAFERALQETAPDLVHIQHLMGLPLGILTRLRAARVPTVITLHDYWWVCANAQLLTNYDATVCNGPRGCLNCTRCAVARGGTALWPAAPALWASLVWRNRRLAAGLREADLIITPSRFVAEWHAGQGVASERIRVRPWGIDAPAHPPRLPRPVASGPLRLAVIGGLAWQKGVHVAVDAATVAGDHVTLAVAGSGDDAYTAELQRRAGSNVTFLGRLDRPSVAGLLAASDAVLLPSLWYESYSMTLHEAWAAGVPVIASNLGVMASTVTHGVDGLLVTPGDVQAWATTLARLAADRDELARLARGIQPPPTVNDQIDALWQDYIDVLNARQDTP